MVDRDLRARWDNTGEAALFQRLHYLSKRSGLNEHLYLERQRRSILQPRVAEPRGYPGTKYKTPPTL